MSNEQDQNGNRKETALNAVQKAADNLKRRYSDETPSASISFKPGKPEVLRARRTKKKQQKRKDRHARTKVAFLRYSYYDIAFKYFVEQVLDADYVALPEATRRTLELGTQHSNDFVCAPFKHILGDYIEALERGADVLVQFAGPCRLGYYGELQESILRDMGYEPKNVQRQGNGVTYFKQSDHIEELLTRIGAPAAAMEVMAAKVEKEMRNTVNRRVNCDAANVDKAVAASREQVEALTRLTDAGIVATLPVKLQEVAVARLLQPELSLSELAETFDPPLTKSCLNHRMRKLMELAGKEKA